MRSEYFQLLIVLKCWETVTPCKCGRVSQTSWLLGALQYRHTYLLIERVMGRLDVVSHINDDILERAS